MQGTPAPASPVYRQPLNSASPGVCAGEGAWRLLRVGEGEAKDTGVGSVSRFPGTVPGAGGAR